MSTQTKSRGQRPRQQQRRRPQNRRPQRRSSHRPGKPAAKQAASSPWKKFLQVITFGLVDGNSSANASKATAKSASKKRPSKGANSAARTRTPEPDTVESPRLYVGNLSYDATESDLFDLFNGVGIVQNAEVVSYRQTQRSKGFAFVTMQSIDEAKRAVSELHNKEFMGRKLIVNGAKKRPEDSDAA